MNYYEGRTKEMNFSAPKNKRKKLYLVLDCETATLPFANEIARSAAEKKKIAIAKPLIYDIAWVIIDKKGEVYSRHSFLVQETFFVPNVFNTAYYKDKRPIYMKKYANNEIITKPWNEIIKILLFDLEKVNMTFAYNSMFDFKKAIKFTENYIAALYSEYYTEWEARQFAICQSILNNKKWNNPEEFDPTVFEIRKRVFLLGDIWGDSCTQLINTDKYQRYCFENGLLTNSGLFFKTSAESVFGYIFKDVEFCESHTALEDAIIESDLLVKLFKKKAKITEGITYFPFREVGETYTYLKNNGMDFIERRDKAKEEKKRFRATALPSEYYANTISTMLARIEQEENASPFSTSLSDKCFALEKIAIEIYGEQFRHDELVKAYLMYNAFKKIAQNATNEYKKQSAEYMADLFYSMIDEIKQDRKKE